MAGLDGLKAIWNDPKKRPFVLAGAGVATGAGLLAMRRPTDPEAAALEDQDVAVAGEGSDPLMTDPGGAGVGYGTLPPVYAMGGGGDPAFQEQDLSGVFAELDQLGVDFQGRLDDALGRERAANQRARRGQGARLRKAEKRLTAQQKRNRQQDKRIARLRSRGKGKKKGRGRGKGGGSRRPANRPTASQRRQAVRRAASRKSRH